jgi:glycosyltransferase involved in cell wall biosynthesis
MKIKVLHIDSEKGWRGGQQQAVYLFEGLLKRGIESVFVCRPGSKLSEYFKNKALPFLEVPMRGELDIFSAFRIANYARKKGFGIFHLHSAHAHSIGLMAKLFYPKVKLIGVRRVDFKIKNNIFSRIKYRTSLINRIVCISEEIKRVMLKCGINEDKLTVIRSGVDINKFDKIEPDVSFRENYGIPKDYTIIGTVAALTGHKDYPNLLKAASEVLKKIQNVTFVAVGDGKNENEIKKLHSELKLGEKFIFAGYQKKIGKYLKAFDIFVLASKKEGLGTSVLDALSIGIPVIATNAGGIPEMIENGVNGILVSKQNPDELAKAILELINNPERMSMIGKNGKETVSKFSIDNTVEKNIELYKKLLEHK